MENQHRRISGYRELSQVEIDLMNKIKQLGPLIEEVELLVRAHVEAQEDHAYGRIYDPEYGRKVAFAEGDSVEKHRLEEATPSRFIALAKTEFQTGLMYLTRAVAQPTFY